MIFSWFGVNTEIHKTFLIIVPTTEPGRRSSVDYLLMREAPGEVNFKFNTSGLTNPIFGHHP